MQRYFLTIFPEQDTFILDQDIRHHLMTVLRGKVGTKAEFVLPDNKTVILAKVVEVSTETTMKICETYTVSVELPVETTLILGLAKGGKPDLVIQKATELGVHHIILVETAWSVVHWGEKAAKKIERLNKIAQGAAEQSHRLYVPDIVYAESLEKLEFLPAEAIKLVAWEESAKHGEKAALVQAFSQLKRGDHIITLVGPEGGLKESELLYLKETLGFLPAGLGPRILRAETAPLYVLSALGYVTELAYPLE